MKGTPSSLSSTYPKTIVDGIILHRAIDRFTDEHPQFKLAKKHLANERIKLAGIIVDIFFDHFLAKNWEKFHQEPIEKFIANTYTTLKKRSSWLPQDLVQVILKLESEDWLNRYRTLKGLKRTFERISRRRIFLAPISDAQDDLISHYQIFEDVFNRFYPEAIEFSKRHPSYVGALTSE